MDKRKHKCLFILPHNTTTSILYIDFIWLHSFIQFY